MKNSISLWIWICS